MGCLLVVMVVAAFLSETVKVTCSNWALANNDLLGDSVHRTLRLLHRCHTKSYSLVYSKFGEGLLGTQDLGLENHWRVPATAETEHWFSVITNFINIECIVCPNRTKLNTPIPFAYNNTHAKYKADKLNSSQYTYPVLLFVIWDISPLHTMRE